MKTPENQERVPYGKTVGQMLKEDPDFMTVLSWKIVSPGLPKDESLVDCLTESRTQPCPELSELVMEWGMSVDEAKTIYKSWIQARRRLRRLTMQGKLDPTDKDTLLGFLRYEYWFHSEELKTGENLRHLAEGIEYIEKNGFQVSSDDVHKILSGQLQTKDRSVKAWLVNYWIKPVDESTPPLCLCADELLDTLITERQVALRNTINGDCEWASPPGDKSLRKALSDLGLTRASFLYYEKRRKRKAKIPPKKFSLKTSPRR